MNRFSVVTSSEYLARHGPVARRTGPYPRVDYGGYNHCNLVTLCAMLDTTTLDFMTVPSLAAEVRRLHKNGAVSSRHFFSVFGNDAAFATEIRDLYIDSTPAGTLHRIGSNIRWLYKKLLADGPTKDFTIGIALARNDGRYATDHVHIFNLQNCRCLRICEHRCLRQLMNGMHDAKCQSEGHVAVHWIEYQEQMQGWIVDKQEKEIMREVNLAKEPDIQLVSFKSPSRARAHFADLLAGAQSVLREEEERRLELRGARILFAEAVRQQRMNYATPVPAQPQSPGPQRVVPQHYQQYQQR